MIGKIIISILLIPINAVILWIVIDLTWERESYKKALFACLVLYVINLLHFIPNQENSFFTSILFNYIGNMYFIILFSGLVLWLIYRFDLASIFFLWAFSAFVRISYLLAWG